MVNQVKKFNTKLHKEIRIFKEKDGLRINVHFKQNEMKIFSTFCHYFNINHVSHQTSIPVVVSIRFIKEDIDFCQIIVKGKCQLRFINNESKLILESIYVKMKNEVLI
jgi:hypothetical protein